ncbi:Alpha/gamma-adaptin-binding protein p34 [Penicillium lividum]|nr:Alpha/gamma-adaptin-binding protein p34 [Penicillium lividum]
MTSNSSPAASSKPKAKQITNPRRLLILSPTTHSVSIIPSLLHALTDIPVHDLPQEQAVATLSTPPDDTAPTSFAGYTTHSPLHLNTKYYSAEIPLWVDEVPLPDLNLNSIPTDETKPTTWRTEFLSDEAEIVRDAVGALLVCVKNPSETDPRPGSDPASRADVRALLDLMREIGAVKERIDEERGGMGDVPGVFVLVGTAKSAVPESGSERERDEMGLGVEEDMGTDDAPFSPGWWEDMLYDLGCIGWEVVEWDPRGQGEKTKNKFGEYEGMPRIKEVLETHDWTGPGDVRDDADQELDDEFEDDLETGLLGGGKSRTRGFGHEVHELEREMLGLRMAIEHGGSDGEDVDFGDFEDGDDEIKVESMEGLMMRVQAIRDMGADLPENERKKFAAKAVHDLMREL